MIPFACCTTQKKQNFKIEWLATPPDDFGHSAHLSDESTLLFQTLQADQFSVPSFQCHQLMMRILFRNNSLGIVIHEDPKRQTPRQ